MTHSLSAMPWIGGKSSNATQGTGPWIASMLPPDRNVAYIEPFAGMLGVLLSRPRHKMEIVNDIDGRLVNWWRCVRDEPDEMTRLLALTPHSRDEFNAAWGRLRAAPDATGVRAALDFSIAIAQNITSGSARGQWAARYAVDQSVSFLSLAQKIKALAERMSEVQIENRPAEELLVRASDKEDALFYIDPPYRYAMDPSDTYSRYSYSRDDMTDALSGLRGKAAISGYEDEWDHLAWQRHEFATHANSVGGKNRAVGRTEVLWTNYEPPQRRLL